MRKLAVAVVAFSALVGGTASASSVQGTPNSLGYAFTGYQDTLYDASGNVVGRASGQAPASGMISSPWGSADMTGWQNPTVTDPPSGNDLISPSIASGCMSHDQQAKQTDITGLFVLFIYHLDAYWCWNSSWGITYWHGGMHWSNVDASFHVLANCVGADQNSCYGWYYTWHGNPMGGHYTSRQGEIEQTAWPTPYVIGYCYPRNQLWVNAGPWYTGKSSAGCP